MDTLSSCEEDLVREFNLMEETYKKKIYTKLGLDFRVVEADSGAIGGSGSKEFHVWQVVVKIQLLFVMVVIICKYEAAKREAKKNEFKRW